jgi:hypothetical protein
MGRLCFRTDHYLILEEKYSRCGMARVFAVMVQGLIEAGRVAVQV